MLLVSTGQPCHRRTETLEQRVLRNHRSRPYGLRAARRGLLGGYVQASHDLRTLPPWDPGGAGTAPVRRKERFPRAHRARRPRNRVALRPRAENHRPKPKENPERSRTGPALPQGLPPKPEANHTGRDRVFLKGQPARRKCKSVLKSKSVQVFKVNFENHFVD